jgi:hypothetical protein
MVGKLMYAVVVLALIGSAKCYNADLARSLSGVPVVGAMISPPPTVPSYVTAIGTAAPNALPTTDPKTWFPTDAAADAYDPTTWAAIREFLANTGTQAGFTEACKKLTDAAGADRTTSPVLGALACSADPSVTALQAFPLAILAIRAEVALWVKGAPGSSVGAIEARQSELRLLCTTDTILRLGGPTSAFGVACTKAMDTSYLKGDGAATFTAGGEAYTTGAAEIDKRDPKTAAAPTYFGDAAKKP